jgi:hypothetical protein
MKTLRREARCNPQRTILIEQSNSGDRIQQLTSRMRQMRKIGVREQFLTGSGLRSEQRDEPWPRQARLEIVPRTQFSLS